MTTSLSRAGSSIAMATSCAVAYLTGVSLQLPLYWVCVLYLTCLALTLRMVVCILQEPRSDTVTFDDQFYEDRPDLGPSPAGLPISGPLSAGSVPVVGANITQSM